MTGAQGLAELCVDAVRNQSVYIIVLEILLIGDHKTKWAEAKIDKIVVEIDPLITAGRSHFQVIRQRDFNECTHAVVFVVAQDGLVVAGKDSGAFCTDRNCRIDDKSRRTLDDFRIAIQIIEPVGRGYKVVMVVTDLKEQLV